MGERYPIDGMTILITGAARGIGAESARRLAARGARVALVGLEPEELASVAASCGPQAAWFEADVTDTSALDDAVAGTVERFGGIDVVVANAGVGSGGTLRSIEPGAFERTVEINLMGTWRTVRACLPHVIERRGYLLNVASLAAILQAPGMGAYGASKAGIEAFSNSLRAELHYLGVDVGVAYFGWIATDMTSGADEHPAFAHFRASLPWPVKKTHPVSAAADAVVHGIERRASKVVAPRWLRALLPVRGLVGSLADRKNRALGEELQALFEQEVREQGAAASAPAGAGGAAARHAGSGADRSPAAPA